MSAKLPLSKKMRPRDYCANDARWNKVKNIAKILKKNGDPEMSASKVLREVTDIMTVPKDTKECKRVSDFIK